MESHTPEHQCYELETEEFELVSHVLNTNVANSRQPACDRPLYSNGDRVAHRTDNSVTALLV